jgi:hypothetical protein
MPTPHAWLLAFLATAAVEAPVVLALTRGLPTPPWRRALIAVFGQLVTHPLVWFVFPRLVGLSGRSSLALSELWAWLAEAAFYAVVLPGLSSARALGTSAIANAASILVGLALF